VIPTRKREGGIPKSPKGVKGILGVSKWGGGQVKKKKKGRGKPLGQ